MSYNTFTYINAKHIYTRKMQTGQVKHITHAKLVSSVKQNVTEDIYIDLRKLEYITLCDHDSDNNENYMFYRSEEDTDYCENNTLILYDFKSNTLKPLHIPIDYHASAAKIYNNMVFVATTESDVKVYNFTTSEYIKTLYTKPTGNSIYHLINYINIYEPEPQNIFVLVKNYKYNGIWNFNTGEYIQYPTPLQNKIWHIYIDNVDNKVYLYSEYEIIVFTDTTFQNYKVVYKFIVPYYSYMVYRFGNYLHAGDIKFDVNTYEKIEGAYNFNCGTLPYFRYPNILFKDCCDIVVTDYNLPPTLNSKLNTGEREFGVDAVALHWDSNPVQTVQKLDALTMCDKSYDDIQQMYVCGNKAYCLAYDGSIKTITIYCTKKCAHDMLTFIETSEMFPSELCDIIMSYVGFKSVT